MMSEGGLIRRSILVLMTACISCAKDSTPPEPDDLEKSLKAFGGLRSIRGQPLPYAKSWFGNDSSFTYAAHLNLNGGNQRLGLPPFGHWYDSTKEREAT